MMSEKRSQYCLLGEDARQMGLPNAIIVRATEADDDRKRAAGIDVSKTVLKDIYVNGERIGGSLTLTGRSYKV